MTISDTPADNENNNQYITMECNASSLNVRSESSTSYIIGKLYKGQIVQVVYSTSTGWSKIKFKNGYGYVSSQYLAKSNQEKPPTSKPDPSLETITIMKCNAITLNVRSWQSTSSTILEKLKMGDKVEVIKYFTNGWAQIKFNNNTAYASTVYLIN